MDFKLVDTVRLQKFKDKLLNIINTNVTTINNSISSEATARDAAISSAIATEVSNRNTELAKKSDTGHTHSNATTSASGFMSAADKTKLDGDRPVTRYEMGLIQMSNNKDNEITLLKSQQYTDKAMFGVQAQLGQQTAWNATQQANLGFLQAQVNDALSISRRFVPNANIAPGWGPAVVEPLIAAEVAKTSSTTSTTTGN